MIPKHYVAMHQVHGPGVNNVAVSSTSVDALLRDLYTPEELEQPPNQVPHPCSGHLLLSCPQRRSIILHGGLSSGPSGLMNDTWEFSVDAQRWIRLICRGEVPQGGSHRFEGDVARASAPAPANDDLGDDEQGSGADEFTAAEAMPPKAFGQCGVLFGEGRFLFVHGGVTALGYTTSGAFQLDIRKRTWTRIPLTHPMPSMWGSAAQVVRLPVRALAATHQSAGASPDGGRVVEVVVVFGGMCQATAFNDTYFLYLTRPPPSTGRESYAEGEERVVVKLSSLPRAIFPGRRRACSAVCNDFFLFIFGGRDENYFYNDMWILNTLTGQWVMVRGETPQRYMQEFFRFAYSAVPAARIMKLVSGLLGLRRAEPVDAETPETPHKSRRYNSSAQWRTGATMVSHGTEVFIFGGFTMDQFGYIITHSDVHAYDYVHHVWREVEVEEGCPLPPFPPGYFRTGPPMSHSPPETPPIQWELVRGLSSVFAEGRTMAAMCRDPVQPSLRFFMYGGRIDDDPCGELFDVRIRVGFREPPSTGNEVLDRQRELARICFSDPTLRSPWERRTLQRQLLDWTRAVLTEGEALSAIQSIGRETPRKASLVSERWVHHVHHMTHMLREKLGALPNVVKGQLSLRQPFVVVEERRG